MGRSVPDRIAEIYAIVRRSRDAGVEKVTKAIASGQKLAGWEVDKAARDVLETAGYAKYLNNRVGHSIGTEVHGYDGYGANIDNFESHDEREVLPNTCFSIEPGIYLPEFGLRSEVNMLVRAGSAEVTGRIQEEMILIGLRVLAPRSLARRAHLFGSRQASQLLFYLAFPSGGDNFPMSGNDLGATNMRS